MRAASSLQSVAGLTPLRAGLLTATIALSAIAGSLAAARLASHSTPPAVITAGAAVSLAGYLVLAQAAPDRPLWIVVAGGSLAVLGLSPATVLTIDLVVASASEERAGSAAALSETSGELGVALGIAVMGTLLTALYRLRLTGSLPTDLDPAARNAAMDGLPSVQRASDALPPELADVLRTTARESFSSAFSTVAFVCAGITIALAAAAILWLRQTPPDHVE